MFLNIYENEYLLQKSLVIWGESYSVFFQELTIYSYTRFWSNSACISSSCEQCILVVDILLRSRNLRTNSAVHQTRAKSFGHNVLSKLFKLVLSNAYFYHISKFYDSQDLFCLPANTYCLKILKVNIYKDLNLGHGFQVIGSFWYSWKFPPSKIMPQLSMLCLSVSIFS